MLNKEIVLRYGDVSKGLYILPTIWVIRRTKEWVVKEQRWESNEHCGKVLDWRRWRRKEEKIEYLLQRHDHLWTSTLSSLMTKWGNYPLTQVGGYGPLAGQEYQTRTLTHQTLGQNTHTGYPYLCYALVLWCRSPSHRYFCTTEIGYPVFPQSPIPLAKTLHSMRGDDWLEES